MHDFFASGRAIDLVLLVVGLELLALVVRHQRGGKGLAPLDLLGQLLAGALLLLAVRCALTGADYRWTAVFLTASFPAHLYDLARRSRTKLPAAPISTPRKRRPTQTRAGGASVASFVQPALPGAGAGAGAGAAAGGAAPAAPGACFGA
jgi:hypothetical protein